MTDTLCKCFERIAALRHPDEDAFDRVEQQLEHALICLSHLQQQAPQVKPSVCRIRQALRETLDDVADLRRRSPFIDQAHRRRRIARMILRWIKYRSN